MKKLEQSKTRRGTGKRAGVSRASAGSRKMTGKKAPSGGSANQWQGTQSGLVPATLLTKKGTVGKVTMHNHLPPADYVKQMRATKRKNARS